MGLAPFLDLLHVVAIPIPVKVSSKMFLRRSQIIGAELLQN